MARLVLRAVCNPLVPGRATESPSRAHAKSKIPDPEFPVIFYTGLSVLDARIHKTLPAEPPDWVLPFSASGISQRMRLHVPPAWAPLYDEIELNVPRSKAGGSRPDPHARELFTDPRMETVKIYRLIK